MLQQCNQQDRRDREDQGSGNECLGDIAKMGGAVIGFAGPYRSGASSVLECSDFSLSHFCLQRPKGFGHAPRGLVQETEADRFWFQRQGGD